MSLRNACANAVTTRARAMYGRMLTTGQYAELARKQTLQEIAGYLKDHTNYATTLEEVRGSIVYRQQLETLLRNHVLYQYAKLVPFAGKYKEFYAYILFEVEIELILSCLGTLGGEKSETYIANLPLFIQPHVKFDILSLAQIETLPQILKLLEHTPYAQILEACSEAGATGFYVRCEHALREWYYTTMLTQAKHVAHGKALEDLQTLLCGRAEISDICTMYRLKKFYQMSVSEIQKQLYGYRWHLSPKEMEQLLRAENGEVFLRHLRATSYSKYLVGDDVFLEEQLAHARRKQERCLMRFSTDPQVIYTAFMLLSGNETENIVRIIEGVHYGMKPEKIESLLFIV